MARLPPTERGTRVRVVQELATRPEPPPRGATIVTVEEVGGPSVMERIHTTRCQVHGCAMVVGLPPPIPTPLRPWVGRDVRLGSDGDSDSIEAIAIVGAVLAVVAVAGGVVAVAVTEGARHDGWIAVEPKQTIHLYRDDGAWLSIPAYALEPELAAWADGAVITEADGDVTRLDRAPLNRRGFTLGFEGGLLGLEGGGIGGGARLSAGGFFHRLVGLQGFVDFAIDDPRSRVRYGAEAQVFVPPIARLHLGAYVQGGRSVARDAEADTRGAAPFLAGGGLLQLELTTRLALHARGGVWLDGRQLRPEVSFGIVVY